MEYIKNLLFYITLYLSKNDNQIDEHDEDAFKPMNWFCEKNGYLWEEHFVTTNDGYILSLWRIPGKNKSL